MGTMGKVKGVVLMLGLVVVCLGDKDPTLSLRPPSASSPVFSSSIDTIPVHSSGTNQHNVYSKRPNSIHSSAAASASGSGSPSSSDQLTSGGRNNNPWYTPANTFGFDYNGGGDTSSGSASSHAASSSSSGSGGYYEHPPAQISASPSTPSDSYSPTNTGGTQSPSYTYFYQHYPTSSTGGTHGWSGGGGDDNGGIFGDLALPNLQLPGLGAGGGGLAGLGGVGGIKLLKIIAKGILVIKPFLIIGLLLLIALPVLFLLLPIPIITITGQPSLLRSARSSPITSYLTQLSGKVLNAEECLERIICKLPRAPEKYETRAKLIWDEYGKKVVSNERVSRGLTAYFESSSQKNKNLKCNQRFKCSNKYL